MAASFQETIGGNPFDNQNRHGYAIVEDHPESEALASLIEAHSAYDHHKARTYETEAAECVFLLAQDRSPCNELGPAATRTRTSVKKRPKLVSTRTWAARLNTRS